MFNLKLFVLIAVAICLTQACCVTEPETPNCGCGKPQCRSCGCGGVKTSGCGAKPCRNPCPSCGGSSCGCPK
ncbi:chorion class high-cysteine HCB protein 13 [Drosophila miranda]|uniref:chorion class high-cysteine HCB protein 13 n=1 Tax=Drosophila miranda TaxID=7229 RepID=UPI0007E8ADFA|nr:chorion class high-cysteine HCB protein 13 [Drosophila miranda]